ncbi:MAG: Flp family type IVb pilin [Actinobacteria bacterium]|nr:MAG: Flp family type IVb pilin [Actinomycetota bacterium]
MFTSLYCRVLGFLKSDEGTTAVEYAVMVALIGAALIITVSLLQGAIVGVLERVTTAINTGA